MTLSRKCGHRGGTVANIPVTFDVYCWLAILILRGAKIQGGGGGGRRHRTPNVGRRTSDGWRRWKMLNGRSSLSPATNGQQGSFVVFVESNEIISACLSSLAWTCAASCNMLSKPYWWAAASCKTNGGFWSSRKKFIFFESAPLRMD